MQNNRPFQSLRLVAILCLLFIFTGSAFSQTIEWQKTHGSGTSGYAVQRLDDGGFIAVGAGGNFPNFDGYLVRTDSLGEKIWDKTITEAGIGTWFNAVKKASDGGFVVVGERGSRPYMWKYSSTGVEMWRIALMGPMGYGVAYSVVAVPDGFVATGRNFFGGDDKVFLHKVGLTGDSVWAVMKTNSKNSEGWGIRQTLDGGFIVTGTAFSGTGKETYLLKTSATGETEWEKTFLGFRASTPDVGKDIAVSSTGYLVVGSKTRDAQGEGSDIDIIKVKLDGTLDWRKQLTSGGYNGATAVRQTIDGFVIVGSEGTSSTYAGHVIKIDPTGNVIFDLKTAAGVLYYVDQAVPPLRFVVVGGSSGKLFLARVNTTVSTTPPDPNTFVYTYNGTPKFGFKTSSGWQGDGPGKIKLKASGYDTVRVNDMVRFDVNTFSLDTTRTSATGSIKFVGIGTMLATGAHPARMKVLGGGVFNGTIDDKGMHFDIPIRSDKDKGFFNSNMAIREIEPGNYPTSGVMKLGGDFRINGLQSCDGSREEIKYSGMSISQTGVAIQRIRDIQLEPGVCYQSLTAKYDHIKDSLSLEGDLISQMLFRSGVRGSSYITFGEISKLTLSTTAAEVPIGREGNYKVKQLTGAYSKWYFKMLNKLFPLGSGALISGILTHPLGAFEVDLKSALLSAPGDLKGLGGPMDYRMNKNGSTWHVSGNGTVKIKWGPDYTTFSVKGGVNAGEMLPGFHAFIGNGEIFANTTGGKPNFTNGKAKGIIRKEAFTFLAAFTSTMGPIASIVGTMFSNVQEDQPADLTLVNNIASIRLIGAKFNNLRIDIDLSKKPSDPGFYTMPGLDGGLATLISRILKQNPKGNKTSAETTNEFAVAERTQSVWIKVAAQSSLLASTLTTPAGAVINTTSADSMFQRIETSATEYWWVINTPEVGTWKVTANGSGSDTITVYAVMKPAPFEITASQQGREVTVSWTNKTDDEVNVFLDNDQAGNDGINIATAAGQSGNATFTLTDNMPECTYYVYAERNNPIEFQSSYATTSLDNGKSILLAPGNIQVTYDETEKAATLSWDSTLDGSTAGFIVRLFGNGQDTVIAMPFGNERTATFIVENPAGKFITMMSYDTNGTRGCWSAEFPVVTSDVKPTYLAARGIEAVVLPNPVRDAATLHFTLEEPSVVNVMIVTAAGHLVERYAAQHFSEGPHDMVLATEGLASGSYIILIEAGDKRQTRNFVITK